MRETKLLVFLIFYAHIAFKPEPCAASEATPKTFRTHWDSASSVRETEEREASPSKPPGRSAAGEKTTQALGLQTIHVATSHYAYAHGLQPVKRMASSGETLQRTGEVPEPINLSFEREQVVPRQAQKVVENIIPNLDLPTPEEHQQDYEDDDDQVDDNIGAYEAEMFPEDDTPQALPYGMQMATHKNLFKCQPCNCSYTHKNNIQAECIGDGLVRIPSSLPQGIISLDMSENPITNLHIRSLSQYPRILSFNLTGQQSLTKVSNDSIPHATSKIEQLYLNNNNISEVEDNSFQFMSSLLILKLNDNSLKRVMNMTLNGLVNLRTLDLSRNAILSIDLGAFDCLTKLKILNMSHNPRFSYSIHHMSPRLFVKLKQLKHLFIQGNSAGYMQYPLTALATLTNLRRLVIDGLHDPATLGPELKSLKNLGGLEFGTNGGLCYLQNITETYFENVPSLIALSLHNCALKNVHPGAYKRIPKLTRLGIDKGGEIYTLDHAFDDLKGLQNSGLKSLTFNKMYQHSLPCVYLRREQARYLQHIHLDELDLSFNSIAVLQDDFLAVLPRTLKKLVLRNNAFNMKYYLLNRIHDFPELRELDISNQNIDERYHPKPRTFSAMCPRHVNDQGYDTRQTIDIEDFDISLDEGNDTANATSANKVTDNDAPAIGDVGKFRLPPKMKILKAARYLHFGLDLFLVHIRSEHSLQEIDLSNSVMTTWGSGTMMTTITKADLSENYCNSISKYFFPFNNSLVHLQLSNNFLGPSFADDEEGETFQELNLLYFLDISTNLIYYLSRGFFRGLPKLVFLDISNNKLRELNVSFATNRKISFIDASKNSISWVSKHSMDTLDDIASNHKVHLDLTLNPLSCSCEGLKTLKWLATTQVIILNKDFLKCSVHGGNIEDIGNLQQRIQQLQKACASNELISILCATAGAVIVTLLILSLLYRYRWRLLYMRNVALARILGNHKGRNLSTFVYDAFIIHTEASHTFVLGELRQQLAARRGYKLCIPDVDFMPGSVIVTDIMAAVMNSKTSIVVVTPDIGQDTWAEYSVKMALNREHFRRQNSLYLLIVDQAEGSERHSRGESRGCGEEEEELLEINPAMTQDLLYVRQRGDFIELPPPRGHGVNDNVREDFWDRLSQHLGHTYSAEQPVYVDGQ